ncbi:HesA/MoeB/ThiF family protein [Vibrio cincinnatiensis]|uniref:HesA/MoeB/ThiF family protein n=1 Tax=Vibrio cincinnatiensis TaxID=675 RepID=UPI0012ACF9D8|nr:HesA/MoeB/ThiF family protein [Vibrio cincinnatiensis]MCG3746428.1 HesA/MoeB/ThiF family protein [Vibrio cincinnatiensis]
MLSDKQFLRYQRQICLNEVGEQGQAYLLNRSVLLIGCGGLGNAAALYLAAAGVGKLVLADDDLVEESNLARQIGFRTPQIGRAKASALAESLAQLNPECKIRPVNRRMDKSLLTLEAALADVVLDCSDNFLTRHSINQVCYEQGVPLISGSAIGWQGQLIGFDFTQPNSGCYACFAPQEQQKSQRCSDSGVMGPVVGTIGNLQALLALQALLKIDNVPFSQFHQFDGRHLSWQQWLLTPDPDCSICSSHLNHRASVQVQQKEGL